MLKKKYQLLCVVGTLCVSCLSVLVQGEMAIDKPMLNDMELNKLYGGAGCQKCIIDFGSYGCSPDESNTCEVSGESCTGEYKDASCKTLNKSCLGGYPPGNFCTPSNPNCTGTYDSCGCEYNPADPSCVPLPPNYDNCPGSYCTPDYESCTQENCGGTRHSC